MGRPPKEPYAYDGGGLTTRKVTKEEVAKYGIKSIADHVEWFTDVTSDAVPVVTLTKNGLGFNQQAASQLEIDIGSVVAFGYNAHKHIMLIRKVESGGFKIGNTGGIASTRRTAMLVRSNNLRQWLESKVGQHKNKFKMALVKDDVSGDFYVALPEGIVEEG